MSVPDSKTDSESKSSEKVSEEVANVFESAGSGNGEPKRLVLIETSHDPLCRSKDNMPVAEVYDCPTYDCTAYYAVRNILYQKKNGYAIDDDILQELDDLGAEKIFIGLRKEKSILEFDLKQYLDCETFDDGFGVQRCASKDNALRVWPNAVGSVIQEEN